MTGTFGKVFCLEGDWHDELTSRASVLPMLELLERLDRITFVHRDIGTRAELKYYLERWAYEDSSVEDYCLLYLAFHSAEGPDGEKSLLISEAGDGQVAFARLGKWLRGALGDVIVYLGSCSMLAESDDVVQRFMEDTGAVAVIGYTTDVDWVPSAAMDLLVMDAIADCSRWKDALSALQESSPIRALRADPDLGLCIISRG